MHACSDNRTEDQEHDFFYFTLCSLIFVFNSFSATSELLLVIRVSPDQLTRRKRQRLEFNFELQKFELLHIRKKSSRT